MTERLRSSLTLILAAFMGLTGSAGFNIIVDPRPNPFTSNDAHDMENRINEDFRNYVKNNYPYDRVEKKLDALMESTFRNHALLTAHVEVHKTDRNAHGVNN